MIGGRILLPRWEYPRIVLVVVLVLELPFRTAEADDDEDEYDALFNK